MATRSGCNGLASGPSNESDIATLIVNAVVLADIAIGSTNQLRGAAEWYSLVDAESSFRRQYTAADTVNIIGIVDVTVAGGLASHSYDASVANPLLISFTPPPSDATAETVVGESRFILPPLPGRQ